MTPRLGVIALFALSACDAVFQLEEPTPGCDSATSHDEDEDNFTDGCDNCPGISNPDQADEIEIVNGQLADGVGDACDPRPRQGGDYIIAFYSFGEPDSMAAWKTLDGHWFVESDQLRYDSEDYAGWGNAINLDAPLTPPIAMEGHVTIEKIERRASGMGLLANSDESGVSAACSIDRRFNDTEPDEVVAYHPKGQTSSPIPDIVNGSSYRMTMAYNPPDGITCAITDAEGQSRGSSREFGVEYEHPIGSLGIDASQVIGAWDYIVVYGVAAAP